MFVVEIIKLIKLPADVVLTPTRSNFPRTAPYFSYVVVDCEHGHLGWETAIQHIRAAVRSTTCVFVRIASSACIDLAGIAAPTKRVLDMGAEVSSTAVKRLMVVNNIPASPSPPPPSSLTPCTMLCIL